MFLLQHNFTQKAFFLTMKILTKIFDAPSCEALEIGMLCFPSSEKNGEREQTLNQSTVLKITDRDFIQTGSKQR